MRNIALKTKAYLLLLMLTPVFACAADQDIQFGVKYSDDDPYIIVLALGQKFEPIPIHVTGVGGNVKWIYDDLSRSPTSTILDWKLTSSDNAQKSCNNISLTLPAYDKSKLAEEEVKLSQQDKKPLPLEGEIYFSLIVTSDTSGASTKRHYIIKVRKAIDIVAVLDRSGSMAWGYDGNVSPPEDQRRWDGLKTGIGAMANTLHNLGSRLLDEDKLGLRMFSFDVIIPGAPFNSNLVSLKTNSTSLTLPSVVLPNPPDGSTALGAGILSGCNVLNTGIATNKKVMIVFSDGEQNAGDLIKETPATDANSYQVTNSGHNISNSGQIKFYTVNLGASGSNPAMMQEIANKNGGTGHFLDASPTTTSANFETYFTSHLIDILSGNSPQFVDICKASFPVSTGNQISTSEQSFSINKGASSIIVTLLAPIKNEVHFTSFVKNGTELIQFADQTSGPGFMSLTLRAPVKGVPYTMLDGEWKVKVQVSSTSKTVLPYTLMIITDDHIVHPEYSLGTGSFKVGDTFNPTVTLQQTGRSIPNATVQAFVGRPGADLNDLIARSNVAFSLPSVDSASPDIAKLAVLMTDSNFVNKIREQSSQVNFAYNASDSTYKGTFNGLNVAGVYQVFYRITANVPNLGKIQRFQQQSFYVRFPDIDLDKSHVITSSDPGTGNSILTARFISRTGKYIGSGWGSTIGINAPGIRKQGIGIQKVEDMGDGTYKVHFNGTLAGNGKLTLFTETFYDGDLATIGEKNNTGLILGVHAGPTFPTGNFNRFYNPGWMVEISAAHQLSGRFYAELVGGWYNFAQADSSFKIIGGTAYLKALAPVGSFRIYAGAGAGLYKPDYKDVSPGVSVKAGVQKSLGNKLWLDLSGAYFYIKTSNHNINFFTASLGLKYSF